MDWIRVHATSAAVIALLIHQSANARDWYVDVNAPPGGDGSSSSPFQTIHEAIAPAIDGDRVLIAAGIYLDSLTIAEDLTLLGAGEQAATLQPSAGGSIVTVTAGADVWLENLRVEKGLAIDNLVARGGGIQNSGTVIAVRCTLANCSAWGQGSEFTSATAYGGGVSNDGTLVMFECEVVDCGAFSTTGFFFEIDGLGYGGALYNSGAARLFSCTFSHCGASGSGGYGGAIFDEGVLRVTNCTVTDNTAYGIWNAVGGGVYTQSGYFGNSTIAYNGAGVVPPIGSSEAGSASGGGIFSPGAKVHDTVIAFNEVGSRDPYQRNIFGPDFCGVMESLGYNLVFDTDNVTIIGDTTGNLYGIDPGLLALADNGGRVRTHALDPTSPCIEAGDPDSLESPAYDARGFPRPLWDPAAGRVDMGAYEVSALPTFLLTSFPRIPLAAGFTLALTNGGGVAQAPVLIAVIRLDGVSVFQKVILAAFDRSGVIHLEGTVPPGLSGTTADLQSYSLDAAGGVIASNIEPLAFE